MLKLLYISIGGAVGAILRYGTSIAIQHFFQNGFPLATLSVNLIGSLIAGFLYGCFESFIIPQNVKLLLFVGFLGSFTTFSAFSLENFNLVRDGKYNLFVINVMANLILGIGLVFLGYFISKSFKNF